jgi:DNA-binding response OmpR family regulator
MAYQKIKLNDLKMKRILIVDDKPALSKLILQFLSKTFNISIQEDGIKALAWLQNGNIPDLILTDLQMPNMDGFELIRRLKESGYFRDIPVMVLSSKEGSEDRIKCLRLGAEDYIVKPFNPEELLIRMQKLLNR